MDQEIDPGFRAGVADNTEFYNTWIIEDPTFKELIMRNLGFRILDDTFRLERL